MRFFVALILCGILVFLGTQVWYFYERGRAGGVELQGIRAQVDEAKAESASLHADYDYYQNAANLEKELRGRFNYKLPDEQMIVIVPSAPSASGTTP